MVKSALKKNKARREGGTEEGKERERDSFWVLY